MAEPISAPATGMDIATGGGGSSETAKQPTESKGGASGGSSGYESGQHERRGIHFEEIVHAVDDLGWDPDGNETIDVPDRDDTLIEVPNGTYQVGHNVFFGTQNWGLVGLGNDVTLQPAPGKCVRALHVSSNDPGQNILVENIEWHQRGGLQAGLGLNITVTDGIEIHNCERTGRTPNRVTAGPPHGEEIIGLTVNVTDPDGHGVVREWTDHCETEVISYPGNAQGISVWDASKGTVRIEDSSVKNQGEHAIYGSKATAVEVVRCVLVDNANTNLRIAGAGSYAEDCRIGYERDAAYTDHARSPGRKATKIVRIEDSLDGASGGHLKDCEVFCETDGLVTGRLAFVMGSSGGFTFDGVTFRNESDSRWCVVQAIGEGWRGLEPPGERWVRFQGCEFVGDAPGEHVEDNRGGGLVTVE